MLQSFQENKQRDVQWRGFQTQFGLYQMLLQDGVILMAEFVDHISPSITIEKVELNRSTFKEYAINPIGTPFQQQVWQAISKIPYGKTMSYLDVAFSMKRQSSVRAVATAIGHNPIAYFIPCHRVIRSNGEYGQYRWGVNLKQQLLDWERNNK